jgi:hypothetical protein
VYGFTDDEAALDKYHQDLRNYQDKLGCYFACLPFLLCFLLSVAYHELFVARQEQLLTLKGPLKIPSTINECYSHKHKETILNAAKSILSLSAYLGIPYYLIISATVSTLHKKLLVNYN